MSQTAQAVCVHFLMTGLVSVQLVHRNSSLKPPFNPHSAFLYLILWMLRVVLFIIFQRWNFHQGPFGVGAMHGLAVVSYGNKNVLLTARCKGWPFFEEWFIYQVL
jgi:hypothetical protein